MEIPEEKKEQFINFGLPFYRVIGNDVMGKILPLGEGKQDKETATMDPAVCAHPNDDLIRRG
eukprot:6308870-Karenia_brevis.AAC.1